MTVAVKALFFDVFGTLVDWRSSVARETQAALSPLGITIDGLAFADAWRGQYQPIMDEVREGRIPFSKLDQLHRRNLDTVLKDFELEGLAEQTRVQLNLSWHRLDAWPDVKAGLARLRPKFLLAPCSNGNISLMVDLARRNGFVWDAILGAEIARDYKPKPVVTANKALLARHGVAKDVAAINKAAVRRTLIHKAPSLVPSYHCARSVANITLVRIPGEIWARRSANCRTRSNRRKTIVCLNAMLDLLVL